MIEAKVHTMPKCDFIDIDDTPCDGEEMFDFKTRYGPWANGCTHHYTAHRRYDELGLGKGQKLILSNSGND